MKLNLEQVRKQRKMSQNKLAMIAGVSHNYISELESGKYEPTASVLCKLAQALGCTLDELVDCGGDEDGKHGL
jgi:transcriptional regulator with XRE-family HTH domain